MRRDWRKEDGRKGWKCFFFLAIGEEEEEEKQRDAREVKVQRLGISNGCHGCDRLSIPLMLQPHPSLWISESSCR